MKPYGLEKRDRIKCAKKGCSCGDMSSKHPIHNSSDSKNKRLKKHARQTGKKIIKEMVGNAPSSSVGELQ